MKPSAYIVIYCLVSMLNIAKPDFHWVISAVLGPCEHLSLAVVATRRLLMGGTNEVTNESGFWLVVHVCVWFIGLSLIWALTHTSDAQSTKARCGMLVLVWIATGVLNVWLFAIRSV